MSESARALTTYHRDVLPDVPEAPLSLAPLCAACPKLCAPSCPVQAATGREAAAPWRISAAVRDAERVGWSAEALQAASSCTGCGACSHACAPGVRLPELSRAARGSAAASGALLPAAQRTAARLAATGSPRPADRWGAELAIGADPAAATALLHGCTVQTYRPEAGRAVRALLTAADEPVRCSAPEACCGAAAADLGLTEEALVLASSCAAQLTGVGRVVVLSPGCARMVRDDWPRLGLVAPEVLTAVEWLDQALAAGRLPAPSGARAAVGWHDPCTLARLLGVLDAPRRVLEALGLDRHEPPMTGLHTRCSGGGQAYPLVDRDGADAVAAARAVELGALGVPVVSACPQAERMLTAAGAPTRDILEVAAERLLGHRSEP